MKMAAHDILELAAKLVRGDRAVTYGDMAILHENIAVLWNAWITVSRGIDPHLTAEDVAHMSALLKMARSKFGAGTEDNYIDAAGYLGIAGELSERSDR